MKTKINKTRILVSIVTVLILAVSFTITNTVKAITEGYALSLSPMNEKIILNPGEEYSSSVKIYESAEYTKDAKYEISTTGYYVNENYGNIFEECDNSYCDMADWITINSPKEGKLTPGSSTVVEFTIKVPEDAAGGGQYASIIFTTEQGDEDGIKNNSERGEDEIASSVTEKKRIAYTIYAEVAGDVTRQGEIISADVPAFLLSGNITGSSAIKNTGNVHGEATYKLQVFPLFSSEEVYTNEEDPATATILPDRTRYEEIAWEQTPSIGIFNVVYTVEFEGVTAQTSKLVIKCPVWLLFIIIFAIIALIMWIVLRVRANRKTKAEN